MQGLALHLVDSGFIDCSSLGSFVFPLFTLQPDETLLLLSHISQVAEPCTQHGRSLVAFGLLDLRWTRLSVGCVWLRRVSRPSLYLSLACAHRLTLRASLCLWLLAAAVSFAWFELLLQPPLPSLVLF